MNINEFVNKIFLRFPPDIKGNDTFESLLCDFLKALNTGKEYNYENAFIELMRNYGYKTTPSPKIVLGILSQNELKQPTVTTKSPQWDNVEADFGGITYEFALNCPFGEARTILEGKGFNNVRLQRIIERTY